MAQPSSGTEVTTDQINELYWSDSGTVEEIIERLGMRKPDIVVRGVDPTWLGRGEVRAEVVRPPAEDLFR